MPDEPTPGEVSAHPSAEEMLDYLDNQVSEVRRAIIEDHIADCRNCGGLASQVGRFSRDWDRCISGAVASTPARAGKIRLAREEERLKREKSRRERTRAWETKKFAGQTATSSWPSTIWTEVCAAGATKHRDPKRVRAFLLQYDQALRAYVRDAYSGEPEVLENMEDLLKVFRRDYLGSKLWIQKAIKQQKPFREFVKRSLQEYIKAKYGAAPTPKDAAALFDLSWDRTLVKAALESTESTFHEAEEGRFGGKRIWELLRLCFIDPICWGVPPASYGRLVQDLGVRSPMELLRMLSAGKELYHNHLTRVVSELEATPESATKELQTIHSRVGAP